MVAAGVEHELELFVGPLERGDQVDGVLEHPELLRLEAELGHVELEVRLVQEAQHHLLAEEPRRSSECQPPRPRTGAAPQLAPAPPGQTPV